MLSDSLKILMPIFLQVWQILRTWWWLPLPFILWWPFSFLWLWWRTDKFLKKTKFILLEIKIPKEVLKPMRAMERVIDGLWQIFYDAPDWWEKWVDGKIDPSLSCSFEIASIGGESHFFIKIPEANRDSIESAIYSQYPEAEISKADDYTKYVPQDIPNNDWDLWGADYKFFKPDPYPIRTYIEFETEREALEEKRVDPLATLLESLAKIKPGEQFWVQIIANPITDKEVAWVTEGKKIRDELARRTEGKPVKKPMLLEAADVLVTGEPPGGIKKEKELIPPEMKLTPGERDIITAVEKKIAKRGFQTSIRFIYLGKKEVFFKPKLRLILSFFSNFGTQNLNFLAPYGQPFITKVPKSWFLPINLLYNRRLYLRKRSIFRKYVLRFHPLFPRKAKWPSSFILNTEELASIFHFPGQRVASAPFIKRIEAKKGEAPPGLPSE